MTFKKIQVHVGNDERCAVRVAIAADLAVKHGALLTGTYAISTPDFPAAGYGDGSAVIIADLIETRRKAEREGAEAAERAFKVVVDDVKIDTAWVCEQGEAHDVLLRQSRLNDLSVVAQTSADGREESGHLLSIPETVVLGAGRPVLMIPYAGRFATLGERPVIAWNQTREAARAVADALPILAGAKQVSVLTISEHGAPADGAPLCEYLARHGIVARTSHSVARDIDVGDSLLSRLADLGADLLVMGAYGHSKMRELVLGGATRSLLRHMTVPVLMSH